jgi:hypothetical protein
MKPINEQTILITGSTDGIGKLAALALAKQQASVLIHGRDNAKLQRVVKELKAASGNDKIQGLLADFASLEQVRRLARDVLQANAGLDVLINNAGVGTADERYSRDGHELRFGVNYLAPFLLTPLNKALAHKTEKSMAVMAVALATGLYATHCLVPPTPGPIAAAGILGAGLGKLIFLGLIVSIPGMLAGYFWATMFARRYAIEPDLEKTYDELMKDYGELPGAAVSFMPLVVPIVLILLKSLANPKLGLIAEGGVANFFNFIGDPVTALLMKIQRHRSTERLPISIISGENKIKHWPATPKPKPRPHTPRTRR